jgi:uncharacterized NAD(P)/FAD-binding protein YdhS
MAGQSRVLIVGAGFSGTSLAVRLLALGRCRVILVERSGAFGRGPAYATSSDVHRLNVRANRMSAFPEDPDHFVRWLAEHARSEADPNGFARRSLYGAYLGDVLRQTAARAPGRLVRRFGEVAAIEPFEDGVSAFLSDGASIEADAVVLATGAPPPDTPQAVKGLVGSSRYVADPWAPNALDLIGRRDDLVLMGTGLTTVDVLLGLEARGWTGKATAISRHGLLPEPHHRATGAPADAPPEKTPLSEALKTFRRRAQTTPWPRLIDEIRPHLQAIWLGMDLAEKRRFLRHLRSWWDVRRHRLAPDAAQRMSGLKAEGRLKVLAAKVVGASRQGEQLLIDVRPRRAQALRTVSGAWLINCTGPAGGMAETDDPLIASLLADGTVRPDPLGLGLDVDAELSLKAAGGESHRRLFALGPLTRGVFWEVSAAADIGVHARDLALRLDGLTASWQSGDEPGAYRAFADALPHRLSGARP